ncbi:MAG: SPOR domain-containing protein [Candidatus Zixiibacteriota bacterium]|nr:MAG: SPOR domain-containing protein [candidate division Zixibacteria bacterium]
MKNIFKVILAVTVTCGTFYSCNRYRSPGSPADIEDRRTSRETRYNLMGFPGDDSVITADVPAADDTIREESDLIPFPEYEPEDDEITEAFSVQLFASKSSEEAENFKADVAALFDELLIIDYRAPYYKVRVGETTTLAEGEALLERVKQMGFTNAWLVRIRY